MTEKQITRELLKLMDRGLVPLRFYLIETTTMAGFPDIYFTGNGRAGLLELKVTDKIKKDSICEYLFVRYERFQRNVLLEHQNYNPFTFLLVYIKEIEMYYLFNTFTERLDINISLFKGNLENVLYFLNRCLIL